jgi:hypothetical protein
MGRISDDGCVDDDRREVGLLINGPPGSGETTALDLVGARGRPFSFMDVDWFHRSWPPNEDGNRVIEARAMGALWRAYRAVGERTLVVSGSVSSPEALQRYEEALGLRLVPIGLSARRPVLEERLRASHRWRPDLVRWHVEHLPEVLEHLAQGAPNHASSAPNTKGTWQAPSSDGRRNCTPFHVKPRPGTRSTPAHSERTAARECGATSSTAKRPARPSVAPPQEPHRSSSHRPDPADHQCSSPPPLSPATDRLGRIGPPPGGVHAPTGPRPARS